MADLDDFFAKKDKKKGKTTKKFTTTDDLAKKLEETTKKTEKLKKEKMTTSSVPTNNLAQDIVADETAAPTLRDEDEWKEFIEEKKDYSGLKIQHLQISDHDVENGDQDDSNDDGFDEEGNERESGSKKKQGPWKMVQHAPEPEPEPKPEEKPAPPPSEPPSRNSVYVPPSMRNAAKATERLPLKSLKKGATPDFKNEEAFPTLEAAKKAPSASSPWGRKRTEEAAAPSPSVFRDSRTIRGPPSSNSGVYRPPQASSNDAYRPPQASSTGAYRPPSMRSGADSSRSSYANKYNSLSSDRS